MLREELWRARGFMTRVARNLHYKNNRRIGGGSQEARRGGMCGWQGTCYSDGAQTTKLREKGDRRSSRAPMIVRMMCVLPPSCSLVTAIGQMPPTGCSTGSMCSRVARSSPVRNIGSSTATSSSFDLLRATSIGFHPLPPFFR